MWKEHRNLCDVALMLRQKPIISCCDVAVVWGQIVCAPKFSLLPARGWNWFFSTMDGNTTTTAFHFVPMIPGCVVVCFHSPDKNATIQTPRKYWIRCLVGLCLLTLRWRFFCDTTSQVLQLLNPSSFRDYLLSQRTLKHHRCLTCGHFVWADDYNKIGIAGATRGNCVVPNKFALVTHWHVGRFNDGIWRTTKRQHASYLGDSSVCFGWTIAWSKCALQQQCGQTEARECCNICFKAPWFSHFGVKINNDILLILSAFAVKYCKQKFDGMHVLLGLKLQTRRRLNQSTLFTPSCLQ